MLFCERSCEKQQDPTLSANSDILLFVSIFDEGGQGGQNQEIADRKLKEIIEMLPCD